MKKGHLLTLIILSVLLIDQVLKVYIKTTFEYNHDVPLIEGANWARLHFVENEGMAFGITFDWVYGKLLLSFFRVLMVAGLIWYMRMLLANKAPFGFLICVALITAGALGNIIDSAVYGMIFTASSYHGGLAEFCAFGQGYANEEMLNGFMHGKVVDMFYFPIKNFTLPEWFPFFGGESFLFFSPIFNVADAAISVGVISIFLFQRRFFKDSYLEEAQKNAQINLENNPVEDVLEKIDALESSSDPETAEPTQELTETEAPAEAAEPIEVPSLKPSPQIDPSKPLL
jgi:signal peptidase II